MTRCATTVLTDFIIHTQASRLFTVRWCATADEDALATGSCAQSAYASNCVSKEMAGSAGLFVSRAVLTALNDCLDETELFSLRHFDLPI
jgi:hypothetical protein